MSGPNADQLLASYHAHPADDRRIVQVLSVICEPVSQAQWQRVLDVLGWTGQRGEQPSSAAVGALSKELLSEGLILRENNRLRCHPDILEVPAREAVGADVFEEIARAAQQVVPLPLPVGLGENQSSSLRRLRNAVYQGDEGAVLHRLGLDKTPFEAASYNDIAQLIRICTRPLDAVWFDALPDVIKFQVLASLLTWSARFLQQDDAAYQLMERYFPPLTAEHRTAAYVLAEQHLHRGHLTGVEALLDGDHSPRGLTILGWLRFLEGRYENAIECFDAALKQIRGKSRRRSIHVRGLPGVFHILALLHQGKHSDLEEAQQLIRVATNAKPSDTLEPVFRILADTTGVLLGNPDANRGAWLQDGTISVDPYLELFRCLALHWIGARPRARQAAKLPRFCQVALESGHLWYARESAALLASLGKDVGCRKFSDNASEYQSIVDLIHPREAWELALDALKQVSGKADETTTASSQPDRRMVWLLRCHDSASTLEPREQKQKKRGGWTQGRSVSLQRLHENESEFDYLTPQDRRICALITPETDYGYYGRYAQTAYRLEHDRALLAAVGHPLVFRSDTPGTPVVLVRAEPVLHVAREQDQLHLRIEPAPADGRNLVVQQEGGNRVRLIELQPEHLRIADILGTEGLRVPLAAEKQVLDSIAAIAPLLNVHSDIGGDTVNAETVPADPRPHLHIQPAGDGLRLELYLQPFSAGGPLFRPADGGTTVFAEVDGKPLQTIRDPAAEQRNTDAVLAQCPSLDLDNGWDWVLDDAESALDTLARLQDLGDAVALEWPQGRKIRLAPELGIEQMSISVRKTRDWFSLDGELQLDDERVLSMKQLFELIGQSPGRFVRLGDDDFLRLSKHLRSRLDAVRGISDNGRFHPLAASAIDEAIGDIPLKAGRPWKELLTHFQQAQTLQPLIPSTLQAELRDYQAEGYRWLARLAHWGGGACLADDMGLGKTLQALTLILTRAPQGPTLILAPTSVCMNWLEEAQRFAPTLRAVRFGVGDRGQMLDEAGPFDLIVCSYGLLQSEAERLGAVEWHTIVADEAQAIKNAMTKRSRAAMSLSSDFRMITTGTPIENHLGELWNLFRFINPGLLGSLKRFNQRFAVPIEERGDQDARQRLKQLIRPFILRRLKSEVLTELPPRTEITLHIELSGEEAALYEALRRQAMERMAEPEEHPGHQRIRMLTEIMRLRRACCHPRLVMPGSGIESAKLRAFTEIVDELLDNRHKALVFSQFVDHLGLIREHLDARRIRYQYLDGSTSQRQRKKAVDAFQAGDGELFLISLKAGGVGLNLTAADYVIHMDPWWNPAVEDQASDRAHRIGQTRPVTIYRLVANDTIEKKIVELHQHKRDLAERLLEGTDSGGRLSVEEMLELIRDD